MKTKLSLLFAILFLVFDVTAQTATGTIYGKVFQPDSTTTIAFSKVWVETPGGNVGQQTDIDGKFKITGLKPGTYILYATAVGFEKRGYQVEVVPEGLHKQDLVMGTNTLPVIVIDPGAPKIETDIISIRIPTTDIAKSPYIRDPKGLLVGTSSDIKMAEGSTDIIIRGSRPGDAVYYVDGMKMDDMTMLPGAAIGSLQAYTGGVPAKYGDTTGGVIILESKSYFDLYYAWKAMQGN